MKSTIPTSPFPRLVAGLAALGVLSAAAGLAQTMTNPSFEATPAFTVFPGYVSGNTAIPGWTGNDNSRVGITMTPAPGPFVNNGAIPNGTNAAFIQSGAAGGSTLSTVITDLTPGQLYKVNFRACARTNASVALSTPNLRVIVDGITNISANVHAVAAAGNTTAAWRFFAFDFTATGTTATVALMNDTVGDTTALVDDFTIAATTGPWSIAQWTNDLTSGVDSSKVYTHAYNFGSANSPVINGVTFTGIATGNPSAAGRFSSSFPTVFGGPDVNVLTANGGGSATMAQQFVYNANPETVTIYGLVPGAEYVATLFAVGWTETIRALTFSVGAERLTVNQDHYGTDFGIRVSCRYIAPATGNITISIAPLVPNPLTSFHCYGFANYEANPQPTVALLSRDAIGAIGNTNYFRAAASGTQPLSFQWLKDGSPLTDQTNATLTVPVLAGTEAGAYSVVVTNVTGTNTSSALNLTLGQIANPSFEADIFYGFPGYVGVAAPNPPGFLISGWTVSNTNRAGLNPIVDGQSPFANNGAIPDGTQVAFIQSPNPGSCVLSTVIQGLTPAQTYTVQFRANARNGQRANMHISIDGNSIVDVYESSVGAALPYRFISFDFTAAGTSALLALANDIAGDHTLLVDNFTITPSTTKWSFAAWNDDATSGVDPTKFYTHAYHFGSGIADTFVNGILFKAAAGANPSATNAFSTAGFGSVFGADVNTVTANGGGSAGVASSFIYGGPIHTITISNLVPGVEYVASIFTVGWDLKAYGRAATFINGSDLMTINLDHFNIENGLVVSHRYTAPPSGTFTLTYVPTDTASSFHTYGFANREHDTRAALVFNTQPSDLTVTLGSTGTFTAAVAGAAPQNLQWYFGPDPIPEATNATLSIFAEFPDVAGNYRLVAGNGSGSITSRLARLTVRLPVIGLFNTGVDGSGVALPDGAGDPHYQIITNADGVPIDAIVENSTAFPIVAGPWIANTANSKWIGPRFDSTGAGQNAGGGLYVYRTTFDCTGLDLGSIIITGGWATDNVGLTIRVNGVDTLFTVPDFSALRTFTLASSNATFIDGINTLDFVVRNDDAGVGYTGLRVGNLSGTASLPSTPPEITSQPQGYHRGTSEDHTFTMGYTGSSPLAFQWTHNGTNIPGANGPSLALVNITHADAGAYAVTIENPFGTVTSSNAVLTVSDSVPGLFNTGVDDARVALADGSIDPHYQLLQNADGPSPDAIVENSTVFPIVAGPWVPNEATSKWIGPRLDTVGAASGDYTYRATVDLTGFDTTSIEITGEWASDNSGLDILVNGVSSGQVNTTEFTAYTPFRLTNGFTSGINTIDFKLNNAAVGYTGLRVRGIRGLGTLFPSNTPPFIVTQPADAVGNFNQTTTFTVLANGHAPLSYQWYFGVDPLPDATNASLSVFVEFPDVAGFYSVEISNGAGSTNSRMAELTINNPPVVPARGAATMQDTPTTIATGKFLTGVTDPDGDSVTLDSAATASAQGGTILPAVGGYIYTPAPGYSGPDSFTFVVRDSRGGLATGTMDMLVVAGAVPASNQVLLMPRPGGGFLMRFAGVPGRAYNIQRATTLGPPDWTTIATRVAPPHGIIEFEDATVLPSAFYRTAAAP